MLVCIVCEKYEISSKGESFKCAGCLDDPLEIGCYKTCNSCETLHYGNVECSFCRVRDRIKSTAKEVYA